MNTREFPGISFRLFIGRIPTEPTCNFLVWYQTPTIFYVNPLNKVHCLSQSTNLP